jgi:hypothetical protein
MPRLRSVTLKPWVFSDRVVTGTYPIPPLHSPKGTQGTLDPTPFASLAPTAV